MLRSTIAVPVLAVSLLAAGMTSAQAASYTVADAAAEINAAITASTAEALSGGYTQVSTIDGAPPAVPQKYHLTLTETYDATGAGHFTDESDGLQVESYSAPMKGTWLYLRSPGVVADIPVAKQVAALKHLGRAGATYGATADKTLTAPTSAGFGTLLEDEVVSEIDTADKTEITGGYRYTLAQDAETVTFDVVDGHIIAASDAVTGQSYASTWTYGVEAITLPTAEQTVVLTLFKTSLEAVALPGTLKAEANATRTNATAVAKKADRAVKVADLRKAAAAVVKTANLDARYIDAHTSSVKGGVRIYATDPIVKKKVAYKVTVNKGKVTVTKV